jgi:Trk K+ transport system NAD-binding subunit
MMEKRHQKQQNRGGLEMEKDKKKAVKKSFTLKQRFSYWFDNRIAEGSLGLIRILIVFSVLLVLLIAGLIMLLGLSEEGEGGAVLWDSIATVINAWMPYSSDGSIGYLILMSCAAIGGVLFTSILIGIITSSIEEKVTALKKGNSHVIEEDHLIVLGLYPGEYTLLQQLIFASEGKPVCIVIADEADREEMEQNIRENLTVPKNVRIVCRTADITDPASLEKCSLETCRTVIVSPTEDMKTIKVILAASALLEEKQAPQISVNAILTRNEYSFPPSLERTHNITTLKTNAILSKMIAHSCTQTGLSETFREIFNFEGSEFYLTGFDGIGGMTFEEIMIRTDRAVPSGVFRNGRILVNPPADFIIEEDDRILVFAEESDSAILRKDAPPVKKLREAVMTRSEEETDIVILGRNETLPVILKELPENVSTVWLVCPGISEKEKNRLLTAGAARNLNLRFYEEDPESEDYLEKLARMAGHVVILGDHEKDPEQADMDVIFLLLNLRELRRDLGLGYNITVEMQKEHNQKLAGSGESTDYLVTSSMSSLILAQLAESPALIDVFREILSNEGNELYLKQTGSMGLTGTFTGRDLRRIMLRERYIFLGHLDSKKRSRFNIPLDEEIKLDGKDYLIVFGES